LLTSFVIIAWLWARTNGEKRGRQLIIGLELVAALLTMIALVYLWQGAPAGTTFNYSDLDYAWAVLAILILILGLLQVLFWPAKLRLGLLHIGILLAAQVLHMLLAEPFGNMPLIPQLAQLLSLPLLFVLPAKIDISASPAEPAAAEEQAIAIDAPAE